MNQNLQSSAPSGRGLCPEDVVIIVVVGIGFVGSVIIYVLNLPSIMVAVFLATGVASLVYRFLGGIESATFNLGPVKLAGTIAALIGCAYFINMELECNLSKVDAWFAIDKMKGTPVPVELEGVKGSIERADSNHFIRKQLTMKHVANNRFMVISTEEDSSFKLGYVSDGDLRRINLFNTIKCSDTCIVTDRLLKETKHVDLGWIPFKLSTGTYKNNLSDYILTDSAGDTLHEGSIELRRAEMVKLGDEYYLVGVAEVNHGVDTLGNTKSVETSVYGSVDTLVDTLKWEEPRYKLVRKLVCTLRDIDSVETWADTFWVREPYAKFVVRKIVPEIKP